MQEWSDSVKIAIDLIIACIIISALLVCIGLGQKLMNTMDLQRAAAESVKEFRTANAYEGTTVYPQDVINLILVNQGWPEVEIQTSSGSTKYLWTRTSIPSGSSLTSLSVGTLVDKYKTYTCTLQYNATGELERYIFKEV